ncbi:MAG: SemiSWEET family transporter [Candidatus Pacearchaeota archaeon]
MEILPLLTTIFGTLMGLAYFPQTYKILKRKSAKDVSLFTYSFFGIGVLIWLVYGISITNYPLIISNAVSLVGTLSVIVAYFTHKH